MIRVCFVLLYMIRFDVRQQSRSKTMGEKRSWVIVALWFGTIALLGLLKDVCDRKKPNTQSNGQMADAIDQRLRYEFRTGMQPSTAPSAGQRLALAIVSVVILVPLLGIILGIASLSGWVAPLALILVCLTIIGINIAFNFRS